jgi:hypothetical protein
LLLLFLLLLRAFLLFYSFFRWRRRQQELRADRGAGALPCEDMAFDLAPLNVNVLMPFDCAADPAEAAADEARARKVAAWLWDAVLPALTNEASLPPRSDSPFISRRRVYR